MVGALGRLDAVGMMVFLEDVEVVLDLVESFLAVIWGLYYKIIFFQNLVDADQDKVLVIDNQCISLIF